MSWASSVRITLTRVQNHDLLAQSIHDPLNDTDSCYSLTNNSSSDKVLKRGADTLNIAYEYKLRRTNGQPKKGTYKREQLQLIPKLTTEWYGRAIKGKWAELAKAGVVPKKGVRDGSSDAEQVIDSIPEDQRDGKSYEQLLGRLVQYLRSGMELDDATARLRESLMPDGEQGANPGRLAVLGKE